MFTQNPDADREILLKIDSDKTLLQMCTMNKYAQKICGDDFFHNRLIQKYPMFLNIEDNTNWKKQYLRIVYYISKLQDLGYVEDEAKMIFYDLRNDKLALAILRGDLDFISKSQIKIIMKVWFYQYNLDKKK